MPFSYRPLYRFNVRQSPLLLLAGLAAATFNATAQAKPLLTLAAANFAFKDTSGEVRDQTAEHARRLQALNEAVRHGLAQNRKIKTVLLTCQNDKCNAAEPGLEALAADAKKAGASHLLFGEVHKMSTLVGWIKFAMVDLIQNAPVCERTLSYRGDNDQAWQHAAKFAVRDIESNCIDQQS